MASVTMIQSRPMVAARPTTRPTPRTSRVVMRADGDRQKQKAEYVKKQDEAQKRNPALEKNVSNLRATEHSSGAYGATNQEKDGDRGQIAKTNHMLDALHPGEVAEKAGEAVQDAGEKLKDAVGLNKDEKK
mmetsp:Transcript_5207/g.14935  ORF Transcript_5207/g.14935 Transcript_5207/m.14935 type:complete len:131 (+) Transcript_5207:127-519(+)|eukprot:CAMPEP_0206137302 /NCGR_PEP_ID=MMETSP1473-20131121/2449_1 /ASSEMBLY_ACC=CAM_ASM_001109 /TAXON_ID=1461547 /ORGANISM="Stichococcus sp, Strain RCC1054" /LENGTH=130 /DNA_ID=CAMNT_0053530325 /DNA_START=132 /DNA_END=524 /DNA_ORIENTATION=+